MLKQKFIDDLKSKDFSDKQIKEALSIALDYLPDKYHKQQTAIEIVIREVLAGKIERKNIPNCSYCEQNCRDPRFPVE